MPRERGPLPPRSSRQRTIDTRDPIPRFLIICEGASTEPNYFRAFRVPSDVLKLDIQGTGRNTLSLVDEAVRHQKTGEYDQIWCVMDRDDFPPGHFNQAIETAQRHNIRVAYSNRCFELWYILHFAFHDAAHSASDYANRLSTLLGVRYEKNRRDMYDRLRNRQSDAIRNARRLLESYVGANPAANDPSTTVHLLVEELNQAAR